MKLIEHVYALKNILAHGPASDDFSFSDRLIAHFLSVARARLVEQKIDKYHFISEQTYQDWCATLAPSNFHNCCSVPSVGCVVLKTTSEVPKFLNSRWGNFLKVMDMTGRVIPHITLTQNRLSQYALVPLAEGWFMHDNHIYLLNTTVLTNIIVNGLFNNPQEIHEANCPTTGSNCADFMDETFPIDSDLIDPMYRLALELLLQSYKLPADIENNSRDVQTANGKQ